MTAAPACVRTDTPISFALGLMVEYNCRHLPVLDAATGLRLRGLLDVSKLLYDVMAAAEGTPAMERTLRAVLTPSASGLPPEPAKAMTTQRLMQAAAIMADRRSALLVTSTTTTAAATTVAATVAAAACAGGDGGGGADGANGPSRGESPVCPSKPARAAAASSASCSPPRTSKVVGLLTSKDLLYRCVARGLDAGVGTVGQAMTRAPDTLPAHATVAQALHQLSTGGYRTLPVVEENADGDSDPAAAEGCTGRPMGVLDVLSLVRLALDPAPPGLVDGPSGGAGEADGKRSLATATSSSSSSTTTTTTTRGDDCQAARDRSKPAMSMRRQPTTLCYHTTDGGAPVPGMGGHRALLLLATMVLGAAAGLALTRQRPELARQVGERGGEVARAAVASAKAKLMAASVAASSLKVVASSLTARLQAGRGGA